MAPAAPARKKSDFDPRKFLATIGEGRKVVAFPKKQTIFAQGDAADAVFYIQSRQGSTHCCIQGWEGSNSGDIERRTVLRRR